MQTIKNKFPPFLFLVFLMLGVFFIGTNWAKAVGDAYFPQDTTIVLDVGNFTIVGGSDADTVTASNTQVTVTISTGQSLTIESADRKLLNNDLGYTYSCFSNKSSIIIDTTTTTKTVVITPSSSNCGSTGGGGGGGGSYVSATPTPTPTLTPTPTVTPAVSATPTPTSTPVSTPVVNAGLTPASRGFTNLTILKLKDGDVISAAGSSDPDVYIVNAWGYKRLFLNPAIFKFYGHLGGFSKVKTVVAPIRETLVTSGLFRNCETNDQKVYGVEATGEDTGVLHWVNTTGTQAVADDPNFFKKVFCINSNEFNWYKQGAAYTSVNQIPAYTRANVVSNHPVTPAPAVSVKVRVVSTIPWVNVRDGGSLTSKIIGKVLPGQEFNFSVYVNGWYKIQKDNKDFGWVFGQYVTKI